LEQCPQPFPFNVGVANVNLELLAGSNTITISSISGETAPDLDSIIVVE
jgi:hypothetical protein